MNKKGLRILSVKEYEYVMKGISPISEFRKTMIRKLRAKNNDTKRA